MTELAGSDAWTRLANVVDTARVQHDPVYLTRRSQRLAAVIDADDVDQLLTILDLALEHRREIHQRR